VKLKKMEMQGFKSFANKTGLDFPEGITSIVGPNGSGKSNIADALCWVMGEQSVRALRGSKMEDVIFAGTQKRSSLGFAEVEITLDNSDKTLNVPYEDVKIARRVFRSGESEYAINGNSCRLKDIHELLMDTGLGRDGYSIIGQGKVAEILSAKSEDRRQIFEEAAGISKYRYRREESLRKLAISEENLVRVGDIAGELETQLQHLSVQAEKAKKYLKLREELKELEIVHALKTISEHKSEQGEIDGDLAAVEEQIAGVCKEIAQIDEGIERCYAEIKTADGECESKSGRQKQVMEQLAQVRSEAQVAQNKIENAQENYGRLKEEIADFTVRIKQARDDEQMSVKEQIGANSGVVADLERETTRVNELLTALENELAATGKELAGAERSFVGNESRAKVLADMERDFDGYSKGVKGIMQAAECGKLDGARIIGTVAQILSARREFELAIEMALGGGIQSIITQSEQDAKKAIYYLKQRNLGRATFLPLTSAGGNVITPLKCEGVIGVASDCVDFDPQFRGVVENLLGRTVIVDTFDNAVNYARNSGNRQKIVTLTGEVFIPGGAISGGSKGNSVGLFGRANELAELKEKNVKLRSEIDELQMRARALEDNKAKKVQELAGIQEKFNDARQRTLLLEQQHRLLAEQISGLEDNLSKKTLYATGFDEQLSGYRQKCSQLEEKAGEYEEILADLEKSLADSKNARKERESAVRSAQNSRRELSERQLTLQKECSRLQAKHERAEVEIDAILLKMWEEYELTMTDLQGYKSVERQRNPETIGDIKQEIKDLGNVDVGAIESFKEVAERFEFLDAQRSDLIAAKRDLERIIEEMTSLMKQQFREQFEVINTEFNRVFSRLFGGGKANLQLTEPQEVLTSGIEIEVQPPGKSLQNMQLLSGGEKALTAISLLLAILKVRPAPFCVLDEIDAALDDANVARYAEYLREYSRKTQFVMITHKRGTMEVSNVLYGVTMQEKGVSTLLTLNLDEVVQDDKNQKAGIMAYA
jgi:chromosome segregation protein